MSTSKFQLTPSVSIIIAGAIVAGAIVFTNMYSAKPQAQKADGQPAATKVNVRPPSASEHIMGSASAPIVLIEFSDMQCPYCSMVHPTLKKLVDESNGKIAWVYRQFPLTSIHPQAAPAANAAECVTEQLGNGGFWKFTDAMFADQTKLSSTYYTAIAQALGADPTKFATCVSGKKYQSKIDADTAEAESNGGNGTPFTIVYNTKNGKAVPVSGALPYAQFISVIQSVQ